MPEAVDQIVKQAAQAQKERRLADAEHDWRAAIALLRQEPDGGALNKGALAQALRSLGEVKRKLRHPAAAVECYQEAVSIYRKGCPPLILAHTIRHLGDVHCEADQPASAEPCYCEALELYRGSPDTPPLELANAIRSMAVLKTGQGHRAEARALWEEARDLYAQVQVTEGVSECTARLASLAAR